MSNATQPVKVLQVGAGGMGRAWLDTIASTSDVELVGLIDLDLGVARRAADEAGYPALPIGSSLHDLVDPTGAQAVVNVTVPEAHHPVNIEALFAGLPVLCEKPVAPTVAQALSMMAAAEVSDQLLMISQSRRYYNNLIDLHGGLASLGAISSISCEFFRAPHFGGFREVMAQPLLVDMAIHQFDMARYLTGAEPLAVYCETFNPPWSWFQGDASAMAVFEFGNGTRFGYTGSWCTPGLETSWNGQWRVSAEHGSATWDGDNAPSIEVADAQAEPARSTGPETIAGSLAEFVAALRSGQKQPSGEVHSNVLSLAMVEAAVRSGEQGRRVLIAEILDDAYAEAVRAEKRDDVRDALKAWPSVHTTVGH